MIFGAHAASAEVFPIDDGMAIENVSPLERWLAAPRELFSRLQRVDLS
jgi:hypothetical protein